MKKLPILSLFLITPLLVSAGTYVNKTSAHLTISTKSLCPPDDIVINDKLIDDDYIQNRADCICVENEPCMKTKVVELPENESVVFENDQDQPVTIMSASLNEKREFFPTNNSFNYEITMAKFSPKFPRITINHAQ